MRLSSWLTATTFVLLVWQLKAQKGGRWEVFRYLLILGTSVAVVAVNSSNLSPKEFGDLMQNWYFVSHIYLGLLYFVGLWLWMLLLGCTGRLKTWKKRVVWFTLVFWCLSMLATIPLIF